MKLALLFFLLLPVRGLWAQTNIEDTTEYISTYDESLTLQNVTFLSTLDNVNGVYSKAIDVQLQKMIEANHKWNFVPEGIKTVNIRPEELIGQKKRVKSVSKNLKSDGFFIAELRKDPKETKLHLYLFSCRSGELVTEEEALIPTDNTEIVQVTTQDLFRRIINKIPYDALIVSRTDNRVTINAGTRDGVHVGQNLTAVKIIGAKRHPKRHFIIKSHKALLGQIRIVKADEYLSFADIISESEPGVLNTNVKITGISKVRYESTPWTQTYTPPEQLLTENNKSVFGKKAREWVAKDPPTFGKVGADFSLGAFSNSLGLSNGTNLNSKVSVYPRINLSGEVWITPKLYADAAFAQGIGQSSNPAGSPSELSNSLTHYRLSFGYNFILRNEFFGPKLSVDIGLSSYRMFIDSSGTTGFTTLQYRSLPIGVGGYVPINPSRTWAIGGKAYFHLFPSLNETPFASGGDPDNNINHFAFFAENKISQRLRWKLGLDFMLLSTSFSAGGARTIPASNLSHRFTMFSTGVDYLF